MMAVPCATQLALSPSLQVLSWTFVRRIVYHIKAAQSCLAGPPEQCAGNLKVFVAAASHIVVCDLRWSWKMPSFALLESDMDLQYRIVTTICQTLFFGQPRHFFHVVRADH
jgi:hypothetical protein